MYGTLNIPTTKTLHFGSDFPFESSRTIKNLHFSADFPSGSYRNGAGKGGRGPRAVSFATAESSTATGGGSLYEVLRVDPTATLMEIKTAYRSLAKMYHPDLSGDGRGRDFIEIHNAYATLSDPAARAVYDLSLGRRRTRVAASVGCSGRPRFCPTRRWETDQCW